MSVGFPLGKMECFKINCGDGCTALNIIKGITFPLAATLKSKEFGSFSKPAITFS